MSAVNLGLARQMRIHTLCKGPTRRTHNCQRPPIVLYAVFRVRPRRFAAFRGVLPRGTQTSVAVIDSEIRGNTFCPVPSPFMHSGNRDGMTEIRDGLTTAMRYAVYALGREFGPAPDARTDDSPDPGSDQDFYRILRKPPYEAYKAYAIMRREWGLDVVAVCPDRATVAGDLCYPTLAAVPGRSGRLRGFVSAQPPFTGTGGRNGARGCTGAMAHVRADHQWRGRRGARHLRACGHSRRQRLRTRALGCGSRRACRCTNGCTTPATSTASAKRNYAVPR